MFERFVDGSTIHTYILYIVHYAGYNIFTLFRNSTEHHTHCCVIQPLRWQGTHSHFKQSNEVYQSQHRKIKREQKWMFKRKLVLLHRTWCYLDGDNISVPRWTRCCKLSKSYDILSSSIHIVIPIHAFGFSNEPIDNYRKGT